MASWPVLAWVGEETLDRVDGDQPFPIDEDLAELAVSAQIMRNNRDDFGGMMPLALFRCVEGKVEELERANSREGIHTAAAELFDLLGKFAEGCGTIPKEGG